MATNLINYNDIHVVAESSYLGATYGDGRIISMAIEQDIDNGKLLAKGEYLKPEIYKGEVPTTTNKVYLVLEPPVITENYASAMQAEKYFFNDASDFAMGYTNGLRSYPLNKDDVFTVSAIGIRALADAPVVGNYVVNDGIDIAESATNDSATNGFVGQIIEKVMKSDGAHYRIEVVQNKEIA